VPPQLKTVALVLADISSYTEFITFNKTSLLHATEIIAELLETVIDHADFPLVLNKLEGDAAFLYSDISADPKAGARDVVRQAQRFFGVFSDKASVIASHRSTCPCDACQGVKKLRLKIILHGGEVAFRTIRNFEELSGENVILAHRLLKNSVAEREYLMMTESFYDSTGGVPLHGGDVRQERYEDLGVVPVRTFHP